jgi:hypothetical protein
MCHPSWQTFEIADPEQQLKELLLFIWIILATGTAAAILSWAMVLNCEYFNRNAPEMLE